MENQDTIKSVVITGVSTGIGYAITKVLIEQGIHVFGSVRTEKDAERLTNDFGSLYTPLIFDVTDEEKIKQAALVVREKLQGKKLWGLINNAGIAVPGPLIYLPIEDFRKQLDVNLIGQLRVTQAFVPLLGVDESLQGPPGKIINMSSVAGKSAHPFLGAYAASKHGLEAVSDALRVELMMFGIEVVVIGPGAVQSMIWEKNERNHFLDVIAKSVYQRPLKMMREYASKHLAKQALPSEIIGNLVLNILKAKKPKLRYAPVPKKFINWTLPHLLPKRFVQWLIAKQLGLLTKNG